MKYIVFTFSVFYLFSCSLDKEDNVIFNLNKMNQEIKDSLDFDIKTYTDRIDLTTSYLVDSVLWKAKQGKLDDLFINKLYDTGFNRLPVIEDTNWSRFRISKIILGTMLNSVKDIKESDSPNIKSLKQKLGELSFEDYMSINGFASSNFETDIIFIYEEAGISREELLYVLFVRYFLIEIYKCTWCDEIGSV